VLAVGRRTCAPHIWLSADVAGAAQDVRLLSYARLGRADFDGHGGDEDLVRSFLCGPLAVRAPTDR
jgi:hypothetical protein